MKVWALVPAAGRSTRMGRPKLTLGLGSESVIQRVVKCLERGGAELVFVIAPPIDQPGSIVLANHARVEGAWVIHLDRPTPDMRATVEFGLDAMVAHWAAPDAVLLAPGDLPGLTETAVSRVARELRNHPDSIILPVHGDRRGHPLGLPWAQAQEIETLPPDVGVNALLERHQGRIRTVSVDDEGILGDMDTPEDYRRWTGQA